MESPNTENSNPIPKLLGNNCKFKVRLARVGTVLSTGLNGDRYQLLSRNSK